MQINLTNAFFNFDFLDVNDAELEFKNFIIYN